MQYRNVIANHSGDWQGRGEKLIQYVCVCLVLGMRHIERSNRVKLLVHWTDMIPGKVFTTETRMPALC